MSDENRPSLRERRRKWTVTLKARFLEELADTGDVNAAAMAVNRLPEQARRLKRRDAEFARGWADAYAAGRERLGEELVGCALKPVAGGGGAFDPQLALRVLQLKAPAERRFVAAPPPAASDTDHLAERLEALADKLAKP